MWSQRPPAGGYEPGGWGENEESLHEGGFLTLRRLGSNQRPSGYEPDELPLLYFAMYRFRFCEPDPPAGGLLYFAMYLDRYAMNSNRL